MVIEVKQNGQFVKIPYITADIPVAEAPNDGKQYGRQNETWTEIVETDLSTVEANIAANTAAIATKVDKVTGKGLSTNDYTTVEKDKLASIPAAANIVLDSDTRLTVATTTKNGLMSAADKVQLDSTLTSTENANKVNAAISSVYRVKGIKATIADLPTTGVVVGDVWNIIDSGANYVAVSINPATWDKLSETVDLSPYLLTTTANDTFVKKSGDVLSGPLSLNNTYINVAGTNDVKYIKFSKSNGTEIGSVGTIGTDINLYNKARKNYLMYNANGTLTFEGNTVWHAGNDGAGSGLDADVSRALAKRDNDTPLQDLNYIPDKGLDWTVCYLSYNNTSINMPNTANNASTLLHLGRGNHGKEGYYAGQIAIQSNGIYYRRLDHNDWSNWQKFAFEDNPKLQRYNSYTSITSLTLDANYETIYSELLSNATLSVSNPVVNGQSTTVYVYTPSSVTITIPTTGNYISMCGSSYITTAGGWVEFNLTGAADKWHIAMLEQQ